MKHLFVAVSLSLLFSSLFAQVRSYGPAPGGVRFQMVNGLMEIDPLSADVVRVRYTSLSAFETKQSLVVMASATPQKPAFTVREQGDEILIITDKLMMSVDRSTGGIAYSDPRGSIILAEDGRLGKAMAPATLVG